MTGRHSTLFTLESGQSGLSFYTTRRDATEPACIIMIGIDVFPPETTKLLASSRKLYQNRIGSFQSINHWGFIVHTAADDSHPWIIIDFSKPVEAKTIHVYGGISPTDKSDSLVDVCFSVSADGLDWNLCSPEKEPDNSNIKSRRSINCAHDTRFLRLFRHRPGPPLSIRQVTLGISLEDIRKTIASKYADKLQGSVDISGTICLESARKNPSRYVIRFSTLPIRSSSIALSINRLGRFSNALIQLSNALHIAEVLGARQIYIPESGTSKDIFPRCRRIKALESNVEFVLDHPSKETAVIEGDFFSINLGKYILSKPFSRYQALQSFRHGMDWQDHQNPYPSDVAVVHIRSGDVFSATDKVHPGYGQPPLAFYIKAILHSGSSSIILVFENRLNPIIDPLEVYLHRQEISYHIQQGSLRDDISCLLLAQTLITGNGTFIPGVVALSKSIKTIYSFNKPFRSWGNKNLRVITFKDESETYIQQICRGNWKNSNAQRTLMLEYPLSHIKLL